MAIDFAYRDGDDRVHVLDWKTGKERGADHMQVAQYALYAQRKWDAAPESVVGGLVYLGTGAGTAPSAWTWRWTPPRSRRPRRGCGRASPG